MINVLPIVIHLGVVEMSLGSSGNVGRSSLRIFVT
jgi:hypothetical protein